MLGLGEKESTIIQYRQFNLIFFHPAGCLVGCAGPGVHPVLEVAAVAGGLVEEREMAPGAMVVGAGGVVPLVRGDQEETRVIGIREIYSSIIKYSIACS